MDVNLDRPTLRVFVCLLRVGRDTDLFERLLDLFCARSITHLAFVDVVCLRRKGIRFRIHRNIEGSYFLS